MMTRILAKGYLWLLLALLYSPILIIMVFSFTEAKVLGNWTGFSTKLYSSLFTGGMHHSLTSAIWNTFAIAMLAATASTALGSIAAIGIFNLRTRTRRVMNFANAIPMMNADIITGVSLFLLFVSCGISQGFTTVVLAHITFCTPYVVLSVMPRLKKMNQNPQALGLPLDLILQKAQQPRQLGRRLMHLPHLAGGELAAAQVLRVYLLRSCKQPAVGDL